LEIAKSPMTIKGGVVTPALDFWSETVQQIKHYEPAHSLDLRVNFPQFRPLPSYSFSECCQDLSIIMLIDSLSLKYPPFSHYYTLYIKKYDWHGLKSSTSSQPSQNRLYHSKTHGRDTTSSLNTSVNKRKLLVTYFLSFIRNVKLIRCSIFLSGLISTYNAYKVTLADDHE